MNNSIKNIIFDLGGVVIDIDLNLAYLEFSKLLNITHQEVYHKFYDFHLWNKHEIGEVSDTELRLEINKFAYTQLSDNQIDKAWNSLLIEIPKSRIARIIELSTKYNVFVLSNTNGIHVEHFGKLLFESTGIEKLDFIFKKVYYSHEMKLRKPDIKIYENLLNDAQILASETLFLDDNLDNIIAAQSIGIHGVHVINPLTMLDYLKNY